MKRLLGTCVLGAVVLAGCGEASSDAAEDACDDTASCASTSTPSPSKSDLDATTVAIVSATAAGGRVDLTGVPVGDEAARQEFTAQFRHGLEAKVASAVASASVPEGFLLLAAVVSIGCDVPDSVTATRSPDGWVITPEMPSATLQECLAPVTSVGVVAVPA